MRVRDHILLSTAGAALLTQRLGRGAAGVWAAAVLLDADHYVWYCVRHRRLSLRAAVRFFNGAQPAHASTTRALHHPVALLGILRLAMRRPRLRPLALGMSFHIALDALHEARMRRIRALALARDRFCCRACGAHGEPLSAHVFRQPPLLPSYKPRHLVSLCGPCHEAAHAQPGKTIWS